jgi:hypothetical protein
MYTLAPRVLRLNAYCESGQAHDFRFKCRAFWLRSSHFLGLAMASCRPAALNESFWDRQSVPKTCIESCRSTARPWRAQVGLTLTTVSDSLVIALAFSTQDAMGSTSVWADLIKPKTLQ